MKGIIHNFPVALRMILKDPINLFLAVIPSAIALALYILGVITVLNNTHVVSGFVGQYVQNSETTQWISHVVTALMVIFVFLLMNWTFVIVVGLIAAPFNSMLSSRI